MDTNRLRQFKTLVETQHLRNAAQLLGISHAGLYKSLKVLEGDLQVKIFQSKGRGLEITSEGLRLYEKIPQILALVENLNSSQEVKPEDQPLRLGTFEVFSTHFCGPLLTKHLGRERRIRLLECVPGELERAILEKRIDLGITYLPIPTRGVDFQKITRISMGVYCRNKAFPGVATTELPFVIPVASIPGTPTGVKGLDGWPDNLFPRRVAFEVDMMESALEMARQALAAVHLPDFVVKLHNQKVLAEYQLEKRALLPKFPKVVRDVYIVRLSERVEDRDEKRLAKALRMIC